MRAAGLVVHQDAVGNVFGRLEGDSPRTVLTGSHFDTVVLGGRYDGALGVLAGSNMLIPSDAERSDEEERRP